DKILQRMKRGYTTAEYARLVQEIRTRVPDIGLTTDVIVGFPGEDEASFENTRGFLEQMGFHKVHVFPYSERPGTKAVNLDQKVPIEIIRRREKILKETLAPLTEKYLNSFVGKKLEVLVESGRAKEGCLQGFSENYIRCVFEGADDLKGTLREITALQVSNERLICALKAIPDLRAG
ncbi:MAG: tRNA (N(6)-L-threonylcarbamoyladenosine(37)-C(2))-methylthiotransferase MtaB, partial [Candidatus Omnitrophota bacterium]